MRYFRQSMSWLLWGVLAFGPVALGADAPGCYELRTYYAAPGKLEALHRRFREHTCKLFEKHGMTNVGYWVPVDNPEQRLIYLLSYPSREAREKSWRTFVSDPAWQRVIETSEAGGRLLSRVENVFLEATDYSPASATNSAERPRVFELRTYTAGRGLLDNLNARFRDHTRRLFDKHGIAQIGYWTLGKGQKGSADTLVYLLAHSSKEEASAHFEAFRQDPEWIAAKKASEERAGGSLTVSNGVQSVFLLPTDYSSLR